THEVNMLLPRLIAVTRAHATTVLALRRSILTEKVARRGYHLTREYSVDPLEILFVRDVMRPNVAVLPADLPLAGLTRWLEADGRTRRARLYPVVDAEPRLLGVVRRGGPRRAPDPHRAGAERRRERVIPLRPVFPWSARRRAG